MAEGKVKECRVVCKLSLFPVPKDFIGNIREIIKIGGILCMLNLGRKLWPSMAECGKIDGRNYLVILKQYFQ